MSENILLSASTGQNSRQVNESHIKTLAQRPHGMQGVAKDSIAFNTFQFNKATWSARRVTVDSLLTTTEQPGMRLVYLSYEDFATNPRLLEKFSNHFNIPSYYWRNVCVESMGYFGCQHNSSEPNTNGATTNYCSWIQFIIKQPTSSTGITNRIFAWHKISFFAQWISPGLVTVLCFNLQPTTIERFQLGLTETISSSNLCDPYSYFIPLMSEVSSLFDTSIWSMRDIVRFTELNRVAAMPPNPNYFQLHELGRHLVHSSEAIDVALTSFRSLILQHESFMTEHVPKSSEYRTPFLRTHELLNFHLTILSSLRFRSLALQARLGNEIGLSFNLVGQYNSKISAHIAQAAQSDSAAMKTIAIMTLVFLPGTFVSAVFSTSFFSGGDTEWNISKDFWIYWATLVPVTAVTLIFWLIWQHYFVSRNINQI